MDAKIAGFIEKSHYDEEGRRVIDKVKIEYLSLIPDSGVMDALEFLRDDYIVRMPPVREYVGELHPLDKLINQVLKETANDRKFTIQDCIEHCDKIDGFIEAGKLGYAKLAMIGLQKMLEVISLKGGCE